MTEREKLLVTLQNRIDEARNKGLKTTTVFISTLSNCMKTLKEQEREIEILKKLLFYSGFRVEEVTTFSDEKRSYWVD